jgi:hypothetical protein
MLIKTYSIYGKPLLETLGEGIFKSADHQNKEAIETVRKNSHRHFGFTNGIKYSTDAMVTRLSCWKLSWAKMAELA